MGTDKERKKIVILGGGFAGVYAGRHLEKLFRKHRDAYEIILVNRDNYFTYQPMLAEVVGGSLGIVDSVSSLRRLLKHTSIYIREISEIDLIGQKITLSPNFNHTDLTLHYDYLLLALGNVTDFRQSPGGLHEHALPFKNLADALKIRNRIIDVIETAAQERDDEARRQLLTFVVGGGGFSGVEIVAEINDFARRLAKQSPEIDPKEIRVVLVHSKERLVDRELSPQLGNYTAELLQKRGVEILFNRQLISATPHEAIIQGDIRIPASTIISSVPSNANPLIESLPVEKIHDRIKTLHTLRVPGFENVWAIGDCAAIPFVDQSGYCPPTAQFAVRQAKTVALNIFAKTEGAKEQIFSFKSLGTMAALGHRRAIAELFGCIKLSGFLAWLFWRFVYWMKLPGISRKIRVGFSWFLEMIIPQESVQLKAEFKSGITHLFYAKGETIFHKGDVGDFLYVIISGKVEVVEMQNGVETHLATLSEGEFFGEMALLTTKKRIATVKCLENCELIAIRKQDFHMLVTNFGELRQEFFRTEKERAEKNKELLEKISKNDPYFKDVLQSIRSEYSKKTGSDG